MYVLNTFKCTFFFLSKCKVIGTPSVLKSYNSLLMLVLSLEAEEEGWASDWQPGHAKPNTKTAKVATCCPMFQSDMAGMSQIKNKKNIRHV